MAEKKISHLPVKTVTKVPTPVSDVTQGQVTFSAKITIKGDNYKN